MARKQANGNRELLQVLIGEDTDWLKEMVQAMVQEVLEAEMQQFLGAAPYERTAGRRGCRAGYYSRKLITRVGTTELRVPQDREGKFSTKLFERYQRSEKALVLAILEMYIQGVSTRRIKKVAEELCGDGFSASTVSQLAKKLDEELEKFARRRLQEEYPDLILDARVEKVRVGGVVQGQAVQIAIGVNMEGRRRILAVELADRESTTSWRDSFVASVSRLAKAERVHTRWRSSGPTGDSYCVFVNGHKWAIVPPTLTAAWSIAAGAEGSDLCSQRQPRGAEASGFGAIARSDMAAVLCAFSAQRAGPVSAKRRRGLPDGA